MTTSEQARADALADAETLLNYVYYRPRAAEQVSDMLERAYSTGGWAIVAIANGDEGHAYNVGILAARDAFRAVPGLR